MHEKIKDKNQQQTDMSAQPDPVSHPISGIAELSWDNLVDAARDGASEISQPEKFGSELDVEFRAQNDAASELAASDDEQERATCRERIRAFEVQRKEHSGRMRLQENQLRRTDYLEGKWLSRLRHACREERTFIADLKAVSLGHLSTATAYRRMSFVKEVDDQLEELLLQAEMTDSEAEHFQKFIQENCVSADEADAAAEQAEADEEAKRVQKKIDELLAEVHKAQLEQRAHNSGWRLTLKLGEHERNEGQRLWKDLVASFGGDTGEPSALMFQQLRKTMLELLNAGEKKMEGDPRA